MKQGNKFTLTSDKDKASVFRFFLAEGFKSVRVKAMYNIADLPLTWDATRLTNSLFVTTEDGEVPTKTMTWSQPELCINEDSLPKELEKLQKQGFTQQSTLAALKRLKLPLPEGWTPEVSHNNTVNPALLVYLAEKLNEPFSGVVAVPARVDLANYAPMTPTLRLNWQGTKAGFLGLQFDASHDSAHFFEVFAAERDSLSHGHDAGPAGEHLYVQAPIVERVCLGRLYPDLFYCLCIVHGSDLEAVLAALDRLRDDRNVPSGAAQELRTMFERKDLLQMYTEQGYHGLLRHRLRLSDADKLRRKKMLLLSASMAGAGFCISLATGGSAAALAAAMLGPAAVTSEMVVVGAGGMFVGGALASAGVSSGLGAVMTRRLGWEEYQKRAKRGAIVGAFTGIALGGADALISQGVGQVAANWLMSSGSSSLEGVLGTLGLHAAGEAASSALSSAGTATLQTIAEGSLRVSAGVVGSGVARGAVNAHAGVALTDGMGYAMLAGGVTAGAGYTAANHGAKELGNLSHKETAGLKYLLNEDNIEAAAAAMTTAGEELADLVLDTQQDGKFEKMERDTITGRVHTELTVETEHLSTLDHS